MVQLLQVDKLFTTPGHPRQLQQAFLNLVSNALKYARPGIPPEVRVTCSTVPGRETPLPLSGEDQQRAFYCVAVSDNGIGFEASDAERIFNVPTRLHGNSEYKGTGVGLSIVRKVIEHHNGYIWAESIAGAGSTFRVLLPVD